jgi:hypothetical protein
VANRSDEDGERQNGESNPEGKPKPEAVIRSSVPGGSEGAEFTVHVKLGYKALLLVIVIFDLISLSLREIIERDLFGLIPD